MDESAASVLAARISIQKQLHLTIQNCTCTFAINYIKGLSNKMREISKFKLISHFNVYSFHVIIYEFLFLNLIKSILYIITQLIGNC